MAGYAMDITTRTAYPGTAPDYRGYLRLRMKG